MPLVLFLLRRATSADSARAAERRVAPGFGSEYCAWLGGQLREGTVYT